MVKMSWNLIAKDICDDLKKHSTICPKCGKVIIESFQFNDGYKFYGTTYCPYCGWNKKK
jgi:predicted RNA-binding Zn-ribbon protein involved in translation (DUF1610 family)